MGHRRYGFLLFALALVAPVAASADDSTTTTTSTSTTATSTTTTTRVPRGPTTTSPPELYDPANDAVAPPAAGDEDEHTDVTETPPPYAGPVLHVDLASATFDPRAASTYAQWNQARAELEALVVARNARLAEVVRFTEAATNAQAAVDDAVRAARASSAALRHYATAVYMNPSVEPNEETRRGQMMAQLRDVLVRSYTATQRRIAELREQAARAEASALQARELGVASATSEPAILAGQARVEALAAALRLYAVGDTGTPSGFRFPVAGPNRFSNSWGAPRMLGTSSAHTHKGVDVFAEKSTPLVAVEPGVVVRRGTDRLGGLKLWLIGDSGYLYYYAHLESFVGSVVDGTRVAPGQVVGFVGSSGNAKGGAPHLHFEVHVRGAAVNPYPLLAVASSG